MSDLYVREAFRVKRPDNMSTCGGFRKPGIELVVKAQFWVGFVLIPRGGRRAPPAGAPR